MVPSPSRSQDGVPTAVLVPASSLALTGDVDSNSPAVWDLVEGRRRLHVVTSIDGQPSLSSGSKLTRLSSARTVSFQSHPGHGLWMEAIVADEGGTWYGYYHHEEPADFCRRPERTIARIGAARSSDRGETWEDLGTILEAPPGWYYCGTPNAYFVGGVGDLSVMLDGDAHYLYVFFSQYSRSSTGQGVGVARMPWADRDDPAGQLSVWVAGVWQPARQTLRMVGDQIIEGGIYPPGTSLIPVRRPWHDQDPVNDVFWGPSVHWNTYLEQYVMLLNRASDERWSQEGIYVSFARSLEDPGAWSPPVRLLSGGAWYPQVMGLAFGEGTDKVAGQRARFLMSGISDALIEFRRNPVP
jgi:hypothetical protein